MLAGTFGPNLVGWNHSTRLERFSIASELPSGIVIVDEDLEFRSRTRRLDLGGYSVSGWCELFHRGDEPIDMTKVRFVLLGAGEELWHCRLEGLPDTILPMQRLRGTFWGKTDRSVEETDRIVLRLGN